MLIPFLKSQRSTPTFAGYITQHHRIRKALAVTTDTDDQESFAALLNDVLLGDDAEESEAALTAEATTFVRGVLYASESTGEAIRQATDALTELYGLDNDRRHAILTDVFGDSYATIG